MSVMQCSRRGCPHILCERIILNGSMYICGDCWEELLVVKKSWPDRMTRTEVKEAIEAFMDSDPLESVELVDTDAEFSRLTS